MIHPHHREVENTMVRVRCPECRRQFHERVQRLAAAERVRCPSCHHEMRFHDIGHIQANESVETYIHHVEERTCHPHFRLD
jgi:hydrogenase maturation factor HypF (carbamoyltransferase family)